jgi:hypothetical protein
MKNAQLLTHLYNQSNVRDTRKAREILINSQLKGYRLCKLLTVMPSNLGLATAKDYV